MISWMRRNLTFLDSKDTVWSGSQQTRIPQRASQRLCIVEYGPEGRHVTKELASTVIHQGTESEKALLLSFVTFSFHQRLDLMNAAEVKESIGMTLLFTSFKKIPPNSTRLCALEVITEDLALVMYY